ncbi:MAG: ribonuclease P protein component [Candidatus Saccharibacteria bacterium]|nr:ribonuclease P protein component [Candidatus Saccharibacteria bacterium]
MISKNHRFHGYGSLRYVYRNGKTVRGPLCSLKYVYNPKRSSYRLAVVVSRKVHKSAVVRNRIRRRIYESARRLEDRFLQPHDIVITVFHENIATMPSEELNKLIYAQLKQAKII